MKPEAGPPTDAIVRSDGGTDHVTAVFTRELASVASARHWLGHFLDDHDVRTGVAADAVLVLSELVTNALRHGLGEIVTQGSVNQHELRVAVTDAGTELPQLLAPDPDRIGGLGLHVVASVAETWGVAPFPGGKTVWATLPLARP